MILHFLCEVNCKPGAVLLHPAPCVILLCHSGSPSPCTNLNLISNTYVLIQSVTEALGFHHYAGFAIGNFEGWNIWDVNPR